MQTLISPYRKNNGHAQIIHKIWFSSSLKSSDVSIFFSYFMTNTVLFTNLNIVPVDHKDHKYTFKIFTECYHKVQPAKYFIYKVPGRHCTLGKMHLFHKTSFTTQHVTEFFKPKPKPIEGVESAVWNDVISITTVEREEVRNQLKEVEDRKVGRSSYGKYIKPDPAEIGWYASNHGIANAVWKFNQRFPAINLFSTTKIKKLNCLDSNNCTKFKHQ